MQIDQTNNNVPIITVEQAEGLQKRAKAIDAELEEMTRAYEAKRGLATGTNAEGQIREVEATLMSSGTITLPPPTGRHPNWWAMLSAQRRISAPLARQLAARGPE